MAIFESPPGFEAKTSGNSNTAVSDVPTPPPKPLENTAKSRKRKQKSTSPKLPKKLRNDSKQFKYLLNFV